VAQSSPCEHIHDGEASGIVGLEEADGLLRPGVTGLEMRHAVLLRQTLLCDIIPLEGQEHEASQGEESPSAQ